MTTVKDGHAKVACLTTDFSMQNVLLQMGLKVIFVIHVHFNASKSIIT